MNYAFAKLVVAWLLKGGFPRFGAGMIYLYFGTKPLVYNLSALMN